MTDNEIIKALVGCDGTFAGCEMCPNYKNRYCCTIKQDALDLINRQKAEIERLEKTIKSYEKIRRAYQRYIHGYGWEDLWAVAIKAFSERVKAEMTDKKYKYVTETNYSKTVNSVIDSCVVSIDTLAKKMIGDQKNERQ